MSLKFNIKMKRLTILHILNTIEKKLDLILKSKKICNVFKQYKINDFYFNSIDNSYLILEYTTIDTNMPLNEEDIKHKKVFLKDLSQNINGIPTLTENNFEWYKGVILQHSFLFKSLKKEKKQLKEELRILTGRRRKVVDYLFKKNK